MKGMEGKMGAKEEDFDMYYNRYYLPQCLDYARQTRLNEYGPTLPMSVHMVMSVHVGEPVLVWHAASGLKEPTLSAWCLTMSHFFFYLLSWSPVHFPSFAPLPLCLSWQLSFSLFLGATSACGPPRKSWVAAQYSNVASFMCRSVIQDSTIDWWLQSHTLWLGMSKLCEVVLQQSHMRILKHTHGLAGMMKAQYFWMYNLCWVIQGRKG